MAVRRLTWRWVRRHVVALFVCGCWAACGGTPTEPTPLAFGRWTGGGACVSIAEPLCDLTAGCGHGQFPRPTVAADGTFEIGGTYRIEAGPIGQDPAPPAHFAGVLANDTLRLTVVPTAAGLAAATYTLKRTTSGVCSVPCL